MHMHGAGNIYLRDRGFTSFSLSQKINVGTIQNWGEFKEIQYVLYSAKLLGEKTFMNFVVLEPPTKVFSMKFGHAVPTYDKL